MSSADHRLSTEPSAGIGMDRHVRHLEHDAMAGQLRQRGRGAAEADVQQLDERILLGRQ